MSAPRRTPSDGSADPPASLRSGLPLGRVRGVPIVVTPSWLIIALLLTTVWAPIVRDNVVGVEPATAYVVAFGVTLVFGLCVLAHELSHTLVSLAFGYRVRRIMLFALGGVSEVEREPSRPRDEFLIAAAGPLASVLISAVAYLGFEIAPAGTVFSVVTAMLFWTNLLLAIFNLLPGLPLDGGRLLRAAVCAFGASPLTGTRVAAWSGRIVAVAVAAFGLFYDRSAGAYAATLFTVALAVYLWFGAGQSLRLAAVSARLPDVEVARLLRPGVFVAAGASVDEALQRAAATGAQGVVVLDAANEPAAIVDEASVSAVPAERRPWTPITDVARPLEPALILPVDISATDLLARMQATPAHEYLIVHPDGSPAGVLSAKDFATQLRDVLRAG